MADITEVSDVHDFVTELVGDEDYDITDAGANELWRIWSFRKDNGAEDDLVIVVQSWFAQKEFGKNWPVMFGKIEFDDPDRGAILFDDVRLVDVNIIENEVWDDVTISQALEVVDKTEDDEFAMDERGMIWIPRSQMSIYERDD